MFKQNLLKLAVTAIALGALYAAAVTGTPRNCLTPVEVAEAQANSWQGISLSCNETVRLARLRENRPLLTDSGYAIDINGKR